MARLKSAQADSPDHALAQHGQRQWLSAMEIATMTDLWTQIRASPYGEGLDARRQAYRLCHLAWSFDSDLARLLELWAEERRWEACVEWAKEKPGRSATSFEPFARLTVLEY
jgi:hypothetical protein